MSRAHTGRPRSSVTLRFAVSCLPGSHFAFRPSWGKHNRKEAAGPCSRLSHIQVAILPGRWGFCNKPYMCTPAWSSLRVASWNWWFLRTCQSQEWVSTPQIRGACLSVQFVKQFAFYLSSFVKKAVSFPLEETWRELQLLYQNKPIVVIIFNK